MQHNNWQIDALTGDREANRQLAGWLQHILATELDGAAAQVDDDVLASNSPETPRHHLRYYRLLPRVVMTLLDQPGDYEKLAGYTPVLAHLAVCSDCRTAYTDLYRALRPTPEISRTLPPNGYKVPGLSTIPANVLAHLCQSLIEQAESILYDARRSHSDGSAAARSLLQQAIRFSQGITQREMRGQALSELVRVATLFDGPHSPGEQSPASHSFTWLAGAAGPRRGTRAVRRGGTSAHPMPSDMPAIYLQAHHLEGNIIQQGDTLVLRLHDLDTSLRGHHLIITVPLGSLIEPVQWLGGNPNAIRSLVPVAGDGSLETPLGTTSLRLADHDDRGMLEIMFMRLDVRPAH